MNKKILALSVHPDLSGNNSKGDIKKSFANNIILEELAQYHNVTVHRISEKYPEGQINVEQEQVLLKDHDLILMIGPIYWYNLPAIAKQWIDDVLLYGWAYGSTGIALMHKEVQLVLTSGSVLEEYTADEIGSTIEELFISYKRTFEYCNMIWRPIKFIGGINSRSKTNNSIELKKELIRFARSLIV